MNDEFQMKNFWEMSDLSLLNDNWNTPFCKKVRAMIEHKNEIITPDDPRSPFYPGDDYVKSLRANNQTNFYTGC